MFRAAFVATLQLVLLAAVPGLGSPTRDDRVWPLSGNKTVDLGQSSPFGPRIKISANARYDFHRGVDIPAPVLTPIYAIDDGTVVIAGHHSKYYDPLIQIKHTDWNEKPGCQDWNPSPSYTCRHGYFFSNYMHVNNAIVVKDSKVTKGQLIGHTGKDGKSGFPHLHFEIRAGRSWQKYCCNPWKYLPNTKNDYSTFNADITLIPNYDGVSSQVAVDVSVPPDQLTFNRIELHISGHPTPRKFDFCKDNFSHTLVEMDDPIFEENLLILPQHFNSKSYGQGKKASIVFVFQSLPSGGGTVHAKAYDVFDNVVTSSSEEYY